MTVPLAPGGDVVSLALAPSDSNSLYTLISSGLGDRFFRSLDGGASWQESGLFPDDGDHVYNNLAVDPAQPLTVYAHGSSGLQRSLDGGDTWEKIYPQGEVFTAVSSEIFYAGGGSDACGTGAAKNYHLARSEDGGQTWHSSLLGCLVQLEQIAVLPSEPDVVYLSVYKPGAPEGTLMKSIDGGQTWVTYALPFEGAVSALLIDPLNPQRLYASGVYGIIRSTDGGETWQQSSDKTMGSYYRLALSGGSLYAIQATASKTPVYRSDDGGASWWVSLSMLPAGTTQLKADPSQAGRLWAGLVNYGIYLTENSGGAWLERNAGIQTLTQIKTLAVSASDPSVIFAAVDVPYPGIYKTVNGGQTWSAPLPGLADPYPNVVQNFRPISSSNLEPLGAWYPFVEIYRLLVHPLHPEIAWAATSKGIYETADGLHWTLTMSHAPAIDLAVSPLKPDEPYAVLLGQNSASIAQRHCYYASLPCSWSEHPLNFAPFSTLRIDPFDPQHLITNSIVYLSDHKGNGIFESLDGGATWQQIGLIDVQGGVYDLALDPANPRIMLASLANYQQRTGRLFLSQDGGVTWQDGSAGAPLLYWYGWPWPVAMAHLGQAFMGSINGVYHRRLSQEAWEPDGLQGHMVRALIYQPGFAPFLLAAGDTNLWRLDLPPIRQTWLPILVGSDLMTR